jgi:hypothetical protein
MRRVTRRSGCAEMLGERETAAGRAQGSHARCRPPVHTAGSRWTKPSPAARWCLKHTLEAGGYFALSCGEPIRNFRSYLGPPCRLAARLLGSPAARRGEHLTERQERLNFGPYVKRDLGEQPVAQRFPGPDEVGSSSAEAAEWSWAGSSSGAGPPRPAAPARWSRSWLRNSDRACAGRRRRRPGQPAASSQLDRCDERDAGEAARVSLPRVPCFTSRIARTSKPESFGPAGSRSRPPGACSTSLAT